VTWLEAPPSGVTWHPRPLHDRPCGRLSRIGTGRPTSSGPLRHPVRRLVPGRYWSGSPQRRSLLVTGTSRVASLASHG
jgi:hypothetical protein